MRRAQDTRWPGGGGHVEEDGEEVTRRGGEGGQGGRGGHRWSRVWRGRGGLGRRGRGQLKGGWEGKCKEAQDGSGGKGREHLRWDCGRSGHGLVSGNVGAEWKRQRGRR